MFTRGLTSDLQHRLSHFTQQKRTRKGSGSGGVGRTFVILKEESKGRADSTDLLETMGWV